MIRLRSAWALLGLFLFATSAHAVDTLLVGAAKIEVTPTFPTRLSGYAARKTEAPAGGGPIWAKALAIGEDGKKPVVLVSIDNLGIPDSMVAELAAALEKAGVPRDGVCISASHTHSAPMLKTVAPHIFGRDFTPAEQASIDQYTDLVKKALVDVSIAALRNRQPSLVSWGQGKAGFANNRRTKGGPVDHSLPVLRITTPDGAIRAILVNYACHCTTLNPLDNVAHGDWAGCAQEMLERDHPGAIALTVIGCGADSNPIAMHGPNSIDKARAHAKLLVDETNRLLKTQLTPLKSAPTANSAKVSLPFDTLPTRAQLEELVKRGSYPGYNASFFLKKLDRGEKIPEAIDYRVTSWLFGDDLAMVFLPGEVVVDYALRLKKEYDPGRIWLNAYSNDAPCYIPSERILKEGGYEGAGAMVYYAKPTKFKTGVENIIINAVHAIVPDRFSFAPMPPKLTPEQSVQAMTIKPELRVQVAAAEPLIQSPVAIDWGADGTLWVAEMRDYPLGMDGNFSPGGVIKALRDTNGDGKYDTATEFLRDLPMPTGVMAYRDGVLITAAPEIIFARDTNGDGKADEKRVIAHGFTTENQQARINGLSFNLDNYIYGASGLFGGRVFAGAGDKEVELGGRDFRLSFDLKTLEPVTGLSQQGRVHNDWGDQFGCNNSNWIFHWPLPDEYAKRNPYVPTPSPLVYVPRNPDSARLFPSSVTLERYNEPQAANHVTSACGIAIYRDSLLDIKYRGDAFICEPVHNLVHHQHLTASGVTFAGSRPEDERTSEFLSSTDAWFRPVQMRTGPDGALYVVDMARFVIEHPRWISPEVLRTLDVRAGHDRGRIYRILPAGTEARQVPNLAKLNDAELAAALDNPNGTLRDMIQRVLIERGGTGAVATLGKIAAKSRHAESRSQALWTLSGLNALESATLQTAFTDLDAHVRQQAIRLAEPRLANEPELATACLALKSDPDTRVRYQLALSLGALDTPDSHKVLSLIATSEDPWIRAAVLSSSVHGAADVLASLIARNDERGRALIEPLMAIISHGTPEEISAAYKTLLDTKRVPPAPWRISALARLVTTIDAKSRESLTAEAEDLDRFDAAAQAEVARKGAKSADAKAAIRWLARPGTTQTNLTFLTGLLDPSVAPEIQSAAIRALVGTEFQATLDDLIARWKSFGPQARATLLDALADRPSTSLQLLAAIETGTIPLVEVDPAHRQRLLTSPNDQVKTRAITLLGVDSAKGARAKIVAQYLALKDTRGDATRGATVFANVCSGCHVLGGKGFEIGPDLAALTDRSPEALFTAIFDPNRDVDGRYMAYTAELRDGRTTTGLIASETASTIVLKRQGGESEAVLRSNLEMLASSGKSLMPEGLETQLTPENAVDLLAFLTAGGIRPKTLAGNVPRTIEPGKDGLIRLDATTAEVYGSTLIFEPTYGNLGYWQSSDDRAVWNFRAPRAGTYTVTFEFACPDDSAGNAYELRIGDTRVRKTAGSTGAWSSYHSIFVYEAKLQAGLNRLEIRPLGTIRNALFDLRAVVLTPR